MKITFWRILVDKLDDLQSQLDSVSQQLEQVMSVAHFRDVKPIMFYDCLDLWFNIYKVPKLCPGSIRSLRNVIRLFKLYIRNMLVIDLRPIHFERCFNSLPANKTRKDTFIYARDFLRFAYRNMYTYENFADFLLPVKYKAQEGVAYSQTQVDEIFKTIKDTRVLKLFQFYYLTGVRRSEAFTVRWCDVNFAEKYVHIHGTKTEMSDRFIPMFDKLAMLLQSIDYTSADDAVFKAPESSIKNEIKRLKSKLSYNVNIKNFRTTFATHCADIGIKPKTVQEWLGHTDVRTTQRYYIKRTPTLEMHDIDKYNKDY